MSRKLEIELTSVDVLDLICLLSVQDFAETVEGQLAKNRFKRLQLNLENQLGEKATVEELNAAMEEIESYLDASVFPEFVEEK